MFTLMSGLAERGETACKARAMRLLPVPFSPVIRTLASEGPTLSMSSRTGRIDAEFATNSPPVTTPPSSLRSRSSRKALFSASRCWFRRRARASSIWVWAMASTRALSHGFWMKSPAPRRIASTAKSMVAHAVMTITGGAPSSARTRASKSRPSCPEVVSRV